MASKRARLNKKTLWILGGLLGVETVVCLGMGYGLQSRKTALEQTLDGKEKALADVRTVSASLPALKAEFLKMQSQVQYLEAALPPEEYIPTLLGQVEQTAHACGVGIQEFRPKNTPARSAGAGPDDQKADATGGAKKVQFDVVIHGNYRQVQQFLQSLTRFRKILALDTLNLRPSGSGDAGVSPVLTGNLALTAYVLTPSPEPVATGGSSIASAAASVGAAGAAAGTAAQQAAADRGITQRSGAEKA